VWGRLAAALAFALLLCAGSASAAPGLADIVILDKADARLAPDGLAGQHVDGLKLSHRWDDTFPGRAGRAHYELELPDGTHAEPMALLFTRLGNQAEVRVNDQLLASFGRLGDARFDAAKTSRLVPVPAALLKADGNRLVIDISAQPSRWAGLSLVQFGPAAALADVLDAKERWRARAAVPLAVGFALIGALAAALWHRQRDPLYGWFALAALLGVVRHVDRIWPDVPVPWPAWGAFCAVAYGAHLVTIVHVGALMVGAVGERLRRAMLATLATTIALGIAGLLLHRPLLWTFGLAAIVPYGLAVVMVLARTAWRGGGWPHWLLAGVALLLMVAGLHDLGVRGGAGSGARISLMPFVTFLLAIGVLGLVAQRHNRTVLDYRRLNDELAQRVQQREQALREAFDTLHAQQREQAVLEERQRTMRELHDGVGAQLVALLNLASQGPVDAALVQQQAKLALDEMRLAVDALQPMNGDLTTVLATLRYRLQPRLAAAGIAVDWDMPPLPPLPQLTPHNVMQVQRILLEAVTNVLKHAAATRIRVSARLVEQPAPAIEMSLLDDGRGLQPPPAEAAPHVGRGLANMQARASAIGASLVIENAAPRGTCVRLRWPLAPAV
jgi:signal transduction histidine kinase